MFYQLPVCTVCLMHIVGSYMQGNDLVLVLGKIQKNALLQFTDGCIDLPPH